MASPRRYTDAEYGASIAPEIYGGSFRNNPELCASHFAKMKTSGVRGYDHQIGALYLWSSLHWLHRIKQPTLVLAGDDDPIIPLSNMRLIAKLIPDSKLHVIHDGHLFLVTQAATVAPLVTSFLSKEPARLADQLCAI
jgi:pimeloyl-ACP methyl ester carboxylesterase